MGFPLEQLRQDAEGRNFPPSFFGCPVCSLSPPSAGTGKPSPPGFMREKYGHLSTPSAAVFLSRVPEQLRQDPELLPLFF